MTKKILITGKNSYVGNQLSEWLNKEPEKYEVVKESMRDNNWKEIDFSIFDVVVHVAGIAHQDTEADQETLYYKVNTELTINIATQAKAQGVKQFVFLSSMIVYGGSSQIGETKVITNETIPEPINFYGNSKLLAEEGILPLQSKNFNVVVLRPPMIYGKGSKGNYPLLAKFARISPVFPDIDNQRSMLHIDNLTEFIKLIINDEEKGMFFPQNSEYVNTSNLVKKIAQVNGKKLRLIRSLNFILRLLGKNNRLINKVFGSLIYSHEISYYKKNYSIVNFIDSIYITEGKEYEQNRIK